MKKILLFCFPILIFNCNSASKVASITTENNYAKEHFFQLATPIIKSESILFEEVNRIQLILDLPKTNIHYTLDGSEPTSSSLIFSNEIILKKSNILNARAFHAQHLPSQIVTAEFIKLSKRLSIKNIILNRSPNKNYQGKGSKALVDRKKGTTNFKTNEWLGFAGEDLEVVIEFKEKNYFQKITTSLLSDQNAWIFLPKEIEILISDDGKKFTPVDKKEITPTTENSIAQLYFSTINFEKQEATFVKILIKNISSIPDWHAGKGTSPWLFIDEIIIE